MKIANSYSNAELALFTKVARLYHEGGVRQPDIAEKLNISQSRVSRILSLAQDLGIVKISIVAPSEVHEDLERALMDRLGLSDVIVAHVEKDAKDLDKEILTAIGSAGANYLNNTLATSKAIGISSWSSTLLAAVDSMEPMSSQAQQIVQLLGGVGAQSVQAQANRLTDYLARLTGAQAKFLGAPGLVASKQVRDGLLQDPNLREVIEAYPGLDVALVGIGAVHPSKLLEQSGNVIGAEEEKSLARIGAVGDVCFHYFNKDGKAVKSKLEDRTIGISEADLRNVPRRVGVAGGLHKVDAIKAAAIGGWINVLITDSVTAEKLAKAKA